MKIGVGSDGGDEIFGKYFVKLYRFGYGIVDFGSAIVRKRYLKSMMNL